MRNFHNYVLFLLTFLGLNTIEYLEHSLFRIIGGIKQPQLFIRCGCFNVETCRIQKNFFFQKIMVVIVDNSTAIEIINRKAYGLSWNGKPTFIP